MLTLKQTISTTSQGSQVWMTDGTLAYVNPTNLGGWGSPNQDLNKTALVALMQLSTPDGVTALTPITSAIAFNAGDTNSIIRSIGFNYLGDGHLKCYLFAIDASNDGITTLGGHTLVTNDYYYLTSNSTVYQKAASGPDTAFVDYSLLIGVGAIAQILTDKIFFNQLTIKKNLQYYRDYRDARNSNDQDQVEYFRDILDDLRIDLEGAYWEFTAGLYTQAENIVAELIERHGIISGNIVPVM